mgnify:CR=1 FL=1
MKTRALASFTSAPGSARITPRRPLAGFRSPDRRSREAPTETSRRGVQPDQRTASHADANSANGAFRPIADFPGNWRLRQWSDRGTPSSGKAHGQRGLCLHHLLRSHPDRRRGSERERARHPATDRSLAPATQDASPAEWRLPAILGFRGRWHRRQLPDPALVNSGKSFE